MPDVELGSDVAINFANLNTAIQNGGDVNLTLANGVSTNEVRIAFSNAIAISNALSVTNSTGVEVIFDGLGANQLLSVDANGEDVSFNGVTFHNAYSSGDGGAINLINGNLTLSNSRFDDNTSDGSGNAIHVSGSGSAATISNSVFVDPLIDSSNNDDGDLDSTEVGEVISINSGGIINLLNSRLSFDGAFPQLITATNSNGLNIDNIPPPQRIDSSNIFINYAVPDTGLDGTSLPGIDFFGEATGDYSGTHIERLGDINGDGFDDFFIGSEYHDSDNVVDSTTNEGAVYIVFGDGSLDYTSLADPASSDFIKVSGLEAGDKLSEAGPLGDFNGDGFDDFIVSARNAEANYGATYIIFGENNLNSRSIDLASFGGANAEGFKIIGENEKDDFGWQVTSAGDFNHDGYSDALVSADLHDDNGNRAGAAYIVFGSANSSELDLSDGGHDTSRYLKINGENAEHFFSYSASSAGDFNGDGIDDIIIASPRANYDPYNTAEGYGKAYLIFGSDQMNYTVNLSTLTSDGKGFVIDGHQAGGDGLEQTAYDVEGIGDFNGDGFDDVLIGAAGHAYSYDYGLGTYIVHESGNAFVIFGKPDPQDVNLNSLAIDSIEDDTTGILIKGERAGDHLGSKSAAAGDVNGDGFNDILLSTQGPVNSSEMGRVYLIFGEKTPYDQNLTEDNFAGIVVEGIHQAGQFAPNVAGAGDVDGDGFDDLLISNYYANSDLNAYYSVVNAGNTYLIFGDDYIDELTDEIIGTGTGTDGEDNFIGTDGNDTFNDFGTGDTGIGGEGRDTFRITENGFTSIDGGPGDRDRILFDNDETFILDLRGPDIQIENIERINMGIPNSLAGVNHELFISLENIRDIPGDGKILRINGGQGDTLHLPSEFNGVSRDPGTTSNHSIYNYLGFSVEVRNELIDNGTLTFF